MTELETLQRAQEYIEKLAKGIDPITNREVPEDSVLNQVRLVRCFYYLAEKLQRDIDGASKEPPMTEKRQFVISNRQLSKIRPYPYPVRITVFVDMIYAAAGDASMRHLSATVFTDWLLKQGFLEKRQLPGGETARVPTEAGQRIGLSSRQREGKHGAYIAVYYDSGAQQFLLDHYWEITSKCGRR